MVVIGLAMLVRTLSAGGGPLALGIVLGLLFVAGRRRPLLLHLAEAVVRRTDRTVR